MGKGLGEIGWEEKQNVTVDEIVNKMGIGKIDMMKNGLGIS